MQTEYVFVYGTLRNACKAYRKRLTFQVPDVLDHHATWLGTGMLPGYLLLDLGSYPGIIAQEETDNDKRQVTVPYLYKESLKGFVSGKIIGELFCFETQVSGIILEALDDYEDCSSQSPLPHEYERVIEQVYHVQSHQWFASWVYRLTDCSHAMMPIASGDYAKYLERQE
eukprot:jgi/Galph1/1899/GphlegSOOS_G570.1